MHRCFSDFVKSVIDHIMKKLFLFFILLAIVAIDVQAQTFIQKCSSGQELKYLIQADQKTVALVEIVMEE